MIIFIWVVSLVYIVALTSWVNYKIDKYREKNVELQKEVERLKRMDRRDG